MEEGSEKTREALQGEEGTGWGYRNRTHGPGKVDLTQEQLNACGGGPEQMPCCVGCNGVDLAAGWMPGLRRAWEGGRSWELLGTNVCAPRSLWTPYLPLRW